MSENEPRNLAQEADEFIGEEGQLYMTPTFRIFIPSLVFAAVVFMAIFALPEWRSRIIDILIVALASVTFFYIIPTLYRIRRIFLFWWVNQNREDKGKKK